MLGHVNAFDVTMMAGKKGANDKPISEGATSMDLCRVSAITATAGGPSTFVLSKDSGEEKLVLSSSILVQRVLLDALFTGASVAIELVPGSNIIRRVLPFETGNGPDLFPPNKYRVSRLATQRMADGRDEHLEVFLIKGQDPENAYNVYDQLLQQMLEASFSHAKGSKVAASLDVEFDGNEIATVRIGKPSPAVE